jgi:hypothetical protein
MNWHVKLARARVRAASHDSFAYQGRAQQEHGIDEEQVEAEHIAVLCARVCV